MVLSRNMEVTILDADGREKAAYKVPYGTILLADEGDSKGGQKLAEWDPFTTQLSLKRVVRRTTWMLTASLCRSDR